MPTYAEIAEQFLKFDTCTFGAGASYEEIAHAEHVLGVGLHGGYREFLKQFGWGRVESLELYGLGADVPTHLNLVTVTRSEREEMQPSLRQDLVPLMNDGAGNLYCLDTSAVGEPPIVFWDHAAGPDQEPDVEASDFASWLHGQFEDLKR